MPADEEEIVQCPECAAPMNVGAVAPYSRVICPTCNAENRVKKQFGPYTLTRRHAIGGMSSVFIASDETLNREVALKILSEEFSADERRIAAFEEEARLTASFSHPNVVRVLTTGTAFGRLYIAMEFVPGGHFEHQIREKGKIPETEMLPLAIQIAEGLQGAQSAGLIHRDVKPGNILLDSEGNAKLVDFGLALVTKGGKATASEMWATPYYVPPEAIEGGAEDFRSDIYAFGATLYHALAGKPPCDEETMATDLLREAKKKVVPLKKIAPHLTDETCAVIGRSMAYDPVNRFGSYDEMIDGLKMALKAAHGEAVRDDEGMSKADRRAQQRAKKRRETLTICGVIGLAAASVLTYILMNPKDPEPPSPTARALTVEREDGQGDEESPEVVASRYLTARQAMEKGEYAKAEAAFFALLQDENVQEPTRTWAGLEAIVAAMMDGRTDQARTHAKVAADHLRNEPEGVKSGFTTGVLPVLNRFSQLPFFEPEKLKLGEDGFERFMGYFLAGLKNWEQGGLEQARPFFRKVVEEPSLAGNNVLAWYQSAAGRYLQDFQLLDTPAYRSDPQTAEESRAASSDLNRALTLLKTKGRARFNIRARQIHLAKLIRALKMPSPTQEADDAPADPVDLADLGSLAKEYRFVAIVDRLRALDGDPPGGSRESMLAMAGGALVFLSEMEADLEKRPVTLDLTLTDGTSIVSLVKTPEGQLVGKLANDEVRDLKWTDFPTDRLIELHRELVKNPASEMERLRRHESAIAFEWMAGDKERAMLVASRLCEESSGFKTRWDSLASGLPK